MKKFFLFTLLLANITISFSTTYKFYALSSDAANSKPVYLCELDSMTGAISVIENYSGVVKGNYYAISPDYKHLLVTSLNSPKNKGGLIQYEISEDGTLTQAESQLKTGGIPCHVSFSPDMKYAFSANYADDEISLYNFTDGSISAEIDNIVKPDLSKGHCIGTDPSGKFVHAVFLGLDKVFNYTVEDGKFIAASSQEFFSLPAGYGPRHFVFHPDSNWVYILNETHSSVTSGSYNSETGAIVEIQNISMLPPGFTDNNSAAAIRLHPNGRFLYASNRGHNSIAVYQIADDGLLSIVEYEPSSDNWPRDFNISSDGKFMVVGNEKSNSIFSFRIDELTGELTNTGKKLTISKPLAFVFLPAIEEEPPVTNLGKDILNTPENVYPNPAQNQLHFTLDNLKDKVDLSIITLEGKVIINRKIDGNSDAIDISNLDSGVYIVQLRNPDLLVNQKIIKQ